MYPVTREREVPFADRLIATMTRFVLIYFTFITLLLSVALPSAAQSRKTTKPKSRSLPVAADALSIVQPSIAPGSAARAAFPAAGAKSVPAYVLHGARPGPVIAFLFHGFAGEDVFHETMSDLFGVLDLQTFQGTVLALSFPGRALCESARPCPPSEGTTWEDLSSDVLNAARFLVDVHQRARGAQEAPYAFVYLPNEDQRLATYVRAMAKASLIENVVELKESELDDIHTSATGLQHLSARKIASGQPAIAIEAPALRGENTGQLAKGLQNLLRHLKMSGGSVGWQNHARQHSLQSLPPDFFGAIE